VLPELRNTSDSEDVEDYDWKLSGRRSSVSASSGRSEERSVVSFFYCNFLATF
jgi:hypothetical protein